MNGYGSRKFIVALGFAICGTVAAVFKVIEAPMWLEYMKWVLGIYIGGNAIAKIGEAVAKK